MNWHLQYLGHKEIANYLRQKQQDSQMTLFEAVSKGTFILISSNSYKENVRFSTFHALLQ